MFAPKTLPDHFYVKVSYKRTNKDGTFTFPYVRLSNRPVRYFVQNGNINLWNFVVWNWGPSYTTSVIPSNDIYDYDNYFNDNDYFEVNDGLIIGILRIRTILYVVGDITITEEYVHSYTDVHDLYEWYESKDVHANVDDVDDLDDLDDLEDLGAKVEAMEDLVKSARRKNIQNIQKNLSLKSIQRSPVTYLTGLMLLLRYSSLLPHSLMKWFISLCKSDEHVLQARTVLDTPPESIVDPVFDLCKSYTSATLQKDAYQGFKRIDPRLAKLYNSGALKKTTNVYTWFFQKRSSTKDATRRSSHKGGIQWPWTRRNSIQSISAKTLPPLQGLAHYVLRENGCLRTSVAEIGVAMHVLDHH